MPRNGSGTMTIANSFTAGTDIESGKVNANFSDVASELTGSLPRDGQASMTGQLKAASGTATAPGLSFSADTNSGFYRVSGDVVGVAVGGVEVGSFSAAGYTGNVLSLIPTGTKMLFQQTAAPTGWTKDTTHDNKALRVVTGTASSGGTTDFTSVFASRTIVEANLPAHTHGPGTLAGTTNTTGNHAHTYGNSGNNIAGGSGNSVNDASFSGSFSTSAAGSHSHTVAISSGSTSSAGSGTGMDFAVQYVDLIIATKD